MKEASSSAMEDATPNADLIYHQVVIPSQQVLFAIHGSFTLPNAHDILVVRRRMLELWTAIPGSSGGLECVHRYPLIGDVYTAVAVPTGAVTVHQQRTSFKAAGGAGVYRDGVHYVALTADTGYLTLLRYELAEPPLATNIVGLKGGNEVSEDEGERTVMVTTSLRGTFVKVSEVLLSRSGSRSTVPSMKMTVDERGTALFIAAFMRSKMVVPLRRTHVDPSELYRTGDDEKDEEDEDQEEPGSDDEELGGENSENMVGVKRKRTKKVKGVIVLSTPIEFHRQTVVYSLCALEGPSESVLFAVLEESIAEDVEAEKSSAGEIKVDTLTKGRSLVIYSYVSSLKQVQRTHVISCDSSSYRLIALPAPPHGPGSVIVCNNTGIVWYNLSGVEDGSAATVFRVAMQLPRRLDYLKTKYEPSIISHAVMLRRDDYFLLMQDEQGDLFRVFLSASGVKTALEAFQPVAKGGEKPVVRSPLDVRYYETIPPTRALVLYRGQYLFAASDGAPWHWLFQISYGYTNQKYCVRHVRIPASAPELLPPPSSLPSGLPLPPAVNAMPRAPLPPSPSKADRVVWIFVPHEKLQHLSLRQQFVNTPPINALAVSLPSNKAFEDNEQPEDAEARAMQRQVQITSLCGRGPQSSIVQARYGYAAQESRRNPLNSSFTSSFNKMLTLSSVTALFQQRRNHESTIQKVKVIHETMKNGESTAGMAAKALRELDSLGAQCSVETDLLVLSSLKGTTVLKHKDIVVEDRESGFETSERTLAASTVDGGRGYIQVTPTALHVLPIPPSHSDTELRLGSVEGKKWTPENGKSIIAASASPRGALLSFSGGGIASFHFDLEGKRLGLRSMARAFPTSPALSLLQPPASAAAAAIHKELSALFVSNVSSTSRFDSDFLELAAVATKNKEVHLLEPRDLTKPKCVITSPDNLKSRADISSVLLTYLSDASESVSIQSYRSFSRKLFCFIGYTNGVLVRYQLDRATAEVILRQEMVCGTKPCLLIQGDGETVCFVQCARNCWRCSGDHRVAMPLLFPTPQLTFSYFVKPIVPTRVEENASSDPGSLDVALRLAPASSESESLLSLNGDFLIQYSLPKLSEGSVEFSFVLHSLHLTGRRLLKHETLPGYSIVAGMEHRGYNEKELAEKRNEKLWTVENRSLNAPYIYNSTLQLFHEGEGVMTSMITFNPKEAIMSMAAGRFYKLLGDALIVVVGIATEFHHGELCGGPPSWKQGLLRAFRIQQKAGAGGKFLQLAPFHTTLLSREDAESGGEESDYASALHVCEEVGLLFVGMGPKNGLRVYACGRKQFIRKRHLMNISSRITALSVVFGKKSLSTPDKSFMISKLYECRAEDRLNVQEKPLLVVCGTVTDSIFIATIHPCENNTSGFLMMIARDPVPRFLTCMTVIDEQTVGLADRFGNVVFLRLPSSLRLGFSESTDQMGEAELDMMIQQLPEKRQDLEEIAAHHTGELVTSLQVLTHDLYKEKNIPVTSRVVFYGTALGSVGCYMSFPSEENGALAAYLRPLLRENLRSLLYPHNGVLPYNHNQLRGRGHNVLEGDWVKLFCEAPNDIYSAQAKEEMNARMDRIRRVEAARRSQLELRPRVLPDITDLLAKQRALCTLPPQ